MKTVATVRGVRQFAGGMHAMKVDPVEDDKATSEADVKRIVERPK